MTGLRVDIDPRGVARRTLDRPERRDALDAALMDAMTAEAERLGRDPQVRVVVLAARGDPLARAGT